MLRMTATFRFFVLSACCVLAGVGAAGAAGDRPSAVDRGGAPAGINVLDLGADPTGGSDAVQAFQSAVDAHPDTASPPCEIIVPPGTYAGDLGELSFGHRRVYWRLFGNVVFSGTAPRGAFIGKSFRAPAGERWSAVGEYVFAQDDTTALPFGPLGVSRTTSHTGGFAAKIPNAFSAINTVNSVVENDEWGGVFQLLIDSDTNSAGLNQFVGLASVVRKRATGRAMNLFGGYTELRDDVDGTGTLVGHEMRLSTVGDNGNGPNNIGLDIGVGRRAGTNGQASFGHLIRLQAGDNATATHGIVVRTGATNSDIDYGIELQADFNEDALKISGNPAGDAISVTGTPAGQAIRHVATGDYSRITLGADTNRANDWLATLSFAGHDSGGAETVYSRIRPVLVDPTDGREDGAIDVLVRSAGSSTNAMRIGQGVRIGDPAGGLEGDGSLNVERL